MLARSLVSARNEGVAEKSASVAFLQSRAGRVEGLRWGTDFLVIKSRSRLVNLIPRDPLGPERGQQTVDLIPSSRQIPGGWPSGDSGRGSWGDVPGVSSSSFDLSRGQSEQLVVVILTTHPEPGSPWVLSGGVLLGALLGASRTEAEKGWAAPH